jgi:hypothetical protein
MQRKYAGRRAAPGEAQVSSKCMHSYGKFAARTGCATSEHADDAAVFVYIYALAAWLFGQAGHGWTPVIKRPQPFLR